VDMQSFGRWGEQYATLFLARGLQQCQFPTCSLVPNASQSEFVILDPLTAHPTCRVVWLNADTESNQPYDIVMTLYSRTDGGVAEVVHYIEVKSTSSFAKTEFNLTRSQWECASTHRQYFHVAQVRGAGSETPSLELLTDLLAHLVDARVFPRIVSY
jgi:hypothetical protein